MAGNKPSQAQTRLNLFSNNFGWLKLRLRLRLRLRLELELGLEFGFRLIELT